jgi:hypothetical protein
MSLRSAGFEAPKRAGYNFTEACQSRALKRAVICSRVFIWSQSGECGLAMPVRARSVAVRLAD